jgi:hypothetical protein
VVSEANQAAKILLCHGDADQVVSNPGGDLVYCRLSCITTTNATVCALPVGRAAHAASFVDGWRLLRCTKHAPHLHCAWPPRAMICGSECISGCCPVSGHCWSVLCQAASQLCSCWAAAVGRPLTSLS